MSSAYCESSASVSSPGRLIAIPSAIVEHRRGGHGLAAPQRLGVRRARRDLHADHLDVGPRRLHRDRDPGAQPAAADRHDDLGEIRHVLEQLEPERSLARDDVGVVERVHEREPALVRTRPRHLQALVDGIAADVHLRSLPARRLDLGHRRVGRHEHLARHAARASGRGQALRVVAGGRRHHAVAAPVTERGELGRAPRTLNEPVRCRFSAFSATTPPARSEIVRGTRAPASAARSTRPPVAPPRRRRRRRPGHQSGTARTASISTCAPSGSAATPIVLRAGGSLGKYAP